MVHLTTEVASSPIGQASAQIASPLASKRISHSYYVCMVDYGKGPRKPMGMEAVVNPEHTRRDIVQMLASGESKHVVFIHHVDGLYIEDVTNELFDEAEALCRLQAAE